MAKCRTDEVCREEAGGVSGSRCETLVLPRVVALDQAERDKLLKDLKQTLESTGGPPDQGKSIRPSVRRVEARTAPSPFDPDEKDIDDQIDGPGKLYSVKDVDIGDGNLSASEKDYILKMMTKFDTEVFCPNVNAQYPNTKMPDYAKMKIIVPKGTKPVRIKPYPVSKAREKALEERIQLQLRQGMIEPSSSEWSAPSFVIEKSTPGQFRLLVDYRKLNFLAEKNAWPLPRIDSVASKLSGSKFFTSLDLTDFFYQVSIEEESRKYTGFSTPYAHYQYRVCPQGLAQARTSHSRSWTACSRTSRRRRTVSSTLMIYLSGGTHWKNTTLSLNEY